MRDWEERISEEGVGICLDYVATMPPSVGHSAKILSVLSIRDIYIIPNRQFK